MRRLRTAVLFTSVGVVAAFGLALLGSAADISFVVDGQTPAAADGDVTVVLLDAEFLGRSDVLGWSGLVIELRSAEPGTVVLMPDVFDAANQRLTNSDLDQTVVDTIQVGTGDSASTVLAAVSDWFDRVLLAYDAPVVDADIAVPTVAPQLGNLALAEKSEGTGMRPSALSPSGTGRYLTPLVGRWSASHGDDPYLPSVVLTATDPAASESGVDLDDASVNVSGTRIPVEDGVALRSNYSADLVPGGSHVITASEVIADLGKLRFTDQVVVVGVEPGIGPAVPAPVESGTTSPAIVTANAINTIRTGQYMRPTPLPVVLAVSAVAALLAALVWAFAPWYVAALASAVSVGGWRWLVDQQLDSGRILPFLAPAAAVMAVTAVAVGRALWRALRERRKVSALFSRYVPASIAAQLLAAGSADDLAAGQRFMVTVLFIDVRGFTPIAGDLDPTDVRRLLDHFYTFVSDRVLAEDGTVVKFVGDEVFAVFGAPVTRPDHRLAAIRVATRLQDEHHLLAAALAADGLPDFGCGIGVHSGPVIAAHVGTHVRTQYDVVGETVNIASRLCGLAESGQIVTSERADGFTPAGSRQVKGVQRSIDIHVYASDQGIVNRAMASET